MHHYQTKFSILEHAIVGIIGQIGYYIGGNFNIHIWAWSASLSVSSMEIIEKSKSVSLERCHIFTVRD